MTLPRNSLQDQGGHSLISTEPLHQCYVCSASPILFRTQVAVHASAMKNYVKYLYRSIISITCFMRINNNNKNKVVPVLN
jgi:hypothetical protein